VLQVDAERIARAFEAGVEAAMWCAVTHGHAPDKQRALSAFVASLRACPKCSGSQTIGDTICPECGGTG
jgi:DnaJ-class molecular chaperone